MVQPHGVSGFLGCSLSPFPRPHLARVQPVVEFLLAADAGQDEAVEDVLAQRGEQGAAQADAQQHEQPREVVDAHLQGLRASGGGCGPGCGRGCQTPEPPPRPRSSLTSVTAKTRFPQGTILYHLSCRRSMKPEDL